MNYETKQASLFEAVHAYNENCVAQQPSGYLLTPQGASYENLRRR